MAEMGAPLTRTRPVEVDVVVTREEDGTLSLRHDEVADTSTAETRISLDLLILIVARFNECTRKLGLERST